MKDQIILIDIDELNIKKEYEDLQPKMSITRGGIT